VQRQAGDGLATESDKAADEFVSALADVFQASRESGSASLELAGTVLCRVVGLQFSLQIGESSRQRGDPGGIGQRGNSFWA
jgi:hypothetical protein